MAKMRVHELAKELEIKSQDIIDTLSSNIKFENVASHATIPIKENVIMWL